MTRAELIDWAVAHATGKMVSPVAVAVLRELLGDDWACRLLDATEKREPAIGITGLPVPESTPCSGVLPGPRLVSRTWTQEERIAFLCKHWNEALKKLAE